MYELFAGMSVEGVPHQIAAFRAYGVDVDSPSSPDRPAYIKKRSGLFWHCTQFRVQFGEERSTAYDTHRAPSRRETNPMSEYASPPCIADVGVRVSA